MNPQSQFRAFRNLSLLEKPMKWIWAFLGGGLIALIIAMISEIAKERETRSVYRQNRSCLFDIQDLLTGTFLNEEHPNFDVETDQQDISIMGTRNPSDFRKGWFDYDITILIEVPMTGSFQGSVITLHDSKGMGLGQIVLMVAGDEGLEGSIMLPDPEVHFTFTRAAANGITIFSPE